MEIAEVNEILVIFDYMNYFILKKNIHNKKCLRGRTRPRR